jgi:hypothetical protein
MVLRLTQDVIRYFGIRKVWSALEFMWIKIFTCFITLLSLASYAIAQEIRQNFEYTLRSLTQEPVDARYVRPIKFEKRNDSTFIFYKGDKSQFQSFRFNGKQFNKFVPSPTGVFLYGQEYHFYCDIEQVKRQDFRNLLEANEFDFLGKRYLVFINKREDCVNGGCRFHCYNLFDITDTTNVYQISFASIFRGMDTFGEFNHDGVLDFIRVTPINDKGQMNKKSIEENEYLLTAFTVARRRARRLYTDQGQVYYMFVKGDQLAKRFTVRNSDWFFDLRDSAGVYMDKKGYFAPYISFDPFYRHLFNPDGIRIEKKKYTVFIGKYGSLEAAQEFINNYTQEIGEMYIMVDQYGDEISYEVYAGNHYTKEPAYAIQKALWKLGYRGYFRDFDRMR